METERSAAAQWLHEGKRVVSRSFRLHRPRGAFCHRGWCQQCKVVGESGEVRLACQLPAGATCSGPKRLAPLRFMGRLAEALPPWFWERLAFRPGLLQQPFLEFIRRLSSAPRLPARPSVSAAEKRTRQVQCDVLVVGGGLSGLVAAATLADAGRRVVIVDAARLGGSGAVRPGRRAQATECVAAVRGRVEVHENALCVGLYDGGTRAWCQGPVENVVVGFDHVVVATGAYDRLPRVSGNDLPGVIGLRGFEALAGTGSLPEGMVIGACGDEAELRRAIDAAAAANAALAFVASPRRLAHLPVPTYAERELVKIRGGRGGVAAIELGDGTVLRCGLLVACESQPTYELQAQGGARMALGGHASTPFAVGDAEGRLLVVGEAAGWFDGDDVVARTRAHIREWIRTGALPALAGWTAVKSVESPRIADDAFVCPCEDVRARDVRSAIEEGYSDIELVKRHTGAGTGPCQGKLCHGMLLTCMAAAGLEVRIPTARPLVRPVVLRALVAGPGSE